MKGSNIVKIVADPKMDLPERTNPSIPQPVHESLQNSGAKAASHLDRILSDPRFVHLTIKEQLGALNLAFNRAYGSPDGGVRKNLNVNVNEEAAEQVLNPGTNAITELSRKALRLPELGRERPSSRFSNVDAVEAVIVGEDESKG